MVVMGTITGESIRLDESLGLSDGTRVRVAVEALGRRETAAAGRVALAERTRGLLQATPEQVRAALEADDYGIE